MITNNEQPQLDLDAMAHQLGISKALVRLWGEEFELKAPPFNAFDVAEFQLIHRLIQSDGLTLEAAKVAFSHQRPHLQERLALIDALNKIKIALIKMKGEQ
jgi:hypothetical protein